MDVLWILEIVRRIGRTLNIGGNVHVCHVVLMGGEIGMMMVFNDTHRD